MSDDICEYWSDEEVARFQEGQESCNAALAAERQRREEAEALCAEMAEALRDARAAMHRRNQPSLANRAITRINALLAKHGEGK